MCRICTARANDTVHELVNLTRLHCSRCPLLTFIPSELVNLTILYCFDCPWLEQNAGVYPAHRPAALRIQRWVKKSKRIHLQIWYRTRGFNEWFWRPDQPGGAKHKTQTLRALLRRPGEPRAVIAAAVATETDSIRV